MNAPGADKATGESLAAAMLAPECYPHPVAAVRRIETHISWVFLTGTWVYKVKKPVNLGFLDFSALDLRRRYCEEELRLNRRLAPALYEAVVAIRGTPAQPRINGTGAIIEYAVKMREFPQAALASEMLARGALTTTHVDRLAERIAAFHSEAARADPASPYGAPEAVLRPALENFETLNTCSELRLPDASLQALRDWTAREHGERRALIAARRDQGCIRECHGDLHLRNIAVIDGDPVPFDCIEFSDPLRWIDVMSEVAFLAMDFEDRHRSDFGWRFLNGYLQAAGDYAGLAVLRFHLVYRALVRAKVHALRALQPGIEERERRRLAQIVSEYIALGTRYMTARTPALIITHGLSGSGKTSATQSLIETLGAARARSDVERKRIHGLAPLARTRAAPGAGIYSGAATRKTYDRLLHLAEAILQAGYPAVVDAAFLRRRERDAFRDLAQRLDVPFFVLAFDAPPQVLRERVAHRLGGGLDASEADLAVLERQLAVRENPTPEEEPYVIRVETADPLTPDAWRALIQRLDPGVSSH